MRKKAETDGWKGKSKRERNVGRLSWKEACCDNRRQTTARKTVETLERDRMFLAVRGFESPDFEGEVTEKAEEERNCDDESF